MTTTRVVSMPEMTEEQLRVHRAGEALHRDGASPAGTLELLAAIIEDQTWRKVSDAKGVPFDGRFQEFVAARPPFGLGCDPTELAKVIRLRHPHESVPRVAERMETMRTAVERLVREEVPPAHPAVHAGPGRGRVSEKTDCDTNGLRPDRVDHVIARLKRDDPDLAKRVISGEVTANAAARAKGWRKPRIVVSSPERVAEAIRQNMEPADVARLIVLLMNGSTAG